MTNPKVNGQAYNAVHFAAMPEATAIEKMKADGLTKDDKEAKEAYRLCVETVNKAKEVKAKKKP